MVPRSHSRCTVMPTPCFIAHRYLSGNVQAVLSSSSAPTTGKLTSSALARYVDPVVSGTTTSDSQAIDISTTASRSLSVTGIVNGQTVSWSQSYSFSNVQRYTLDGLVRFECRSHILLECLIESLCCSSLQSQTLVQTATGSSKAIHAGQTVLSDNFDYPLSLQYGVTYDAAETAYVSSAIQHAYSRTEYGSGLAGLHSGSTTKSTQSATSTLTYPVSGPRTGNGTSTNQIDYSDVRGVPACLVPGMGS